MQKELSKEGIARSAVAYQIHQHQVKEGVQKYVYHRPAHGMGMEGHQPPYLAPGRLHDARARYDLLGRARALRSGLGLRRKLLRRLLRSAEGKPALQMARLPWSEDWCLVKV
jgi:hypothetical protein